MQVSVAGILGTDTAIDKNEGISQTHCNRERCCFKRCKTERELKLDSAGLKSMTPHSTNGRAAGFQGYLNMAWNWKGQAVPYHHNDLDLLQSQFWWYLG